MLYQIALTCLAWQFGGVANVCALHVKDSWFDTQTDPVMVTSQCTPSAGLK